MEWTLAIIVQGSHKHGKPENSGNLKNCQNLGENSGKFELLYKKAWKNQGK